MQWWDRLVMQSRWLDLTSAMMYCIYINIQIHWIGFLKGGQGATTRKLVHMYSVVSIDDTSLAREDRSYAG